MHLQLVMLHLLHDSACNTLHCICSVSGCFLMFDSQDEHDLISAFASTQQGLY